MVYINSIGSCQCEDIEINGVGSREGEARNIEGFGSDYPSEEQTAPVNGNGETIHAALWRQA